MPRRLFCLVLLCVSSIHTYAQETTFPKPQPGEAFREFKIYAASGSPLRRPLEDWAGARTRAATDPAWRTWLDGQRATTDEWIAKRRDRIEWVAGWWHNFVSPKDGSFLTWTPDEPGAETLSSPSDSRVKLTPKLHAAWVFGFRRRHALRMIDAAMLYRLTDDERYARWVAEQLDFYADNYTEWEVNTRGDGGKSRLMYQSLDEAVNLVNYVRAARLLGGYVTPERKARWFVRLFKPEADLLEETFQRTHNIACWQRSAVGHVALYYGDAELWQRAVDAPFGIRGQLARGVTSDYLWFEQSFLYNNYVVQALLPFFTYAALEGRADELKDEMSVVQNLTLSLIPLRFPSGQLPNPADSTSVQRAPNLDALAGVYRVFPTALGLARAAQQKSWETLLDPPIPAAPAAGLPPVASRNLESSRMALLKRGPWQVFFHYGQLDASHAQAEALNYEGFYGDTDITHDAGTVGYGSPLHRGYFQTGLAHSVPLVGGHGQEKWARGELLDFDASAARVRARQPAYRPGVSAERELRIEGERLIDSVRLVAAAVPATTNGASPKLGLALHLQGEVRLPPSFVPDTEFAREPRPASFGYWSDAKSATFDAVASFEVNFKDQLLRVTLRAPGKFRLTHGLAPDAAALKREAFYLELLDAEVREANFTTTFEPLRKGGAGRAR